MKRKDATKTFSKRKIQWQTKRCNLLEAKSAFFVTFESKKGVYIPGIVSFLCSHKKALSLPICSQDRPETLVALAMQLGQSDQMIPTSGPRLFLIIIIATILFIIKSDQMIPPSGCYSWFIISATIVFTIKSNKFRWYQRLGGQCHAAAQNLFYTWFVIIASNIFIIRSNEIRLYQRLNRVSTWFTIIGFTIITSIIKLVGAAKPLPFEFYGW